MSRITYSEALSRFIGNLNDGDPAEWGSTMVWIALNSETRLIISHRVGDRNSVNAHAFVSDLRARTEGRCQVTSDRFNAYVGAMREHFEQNVDFGQLRKICGRLRRTSPKLYASAESMTSARLPSAFFAMIS
jgi:hypothetical protein